MLISDLESDMIKKIAVIMCTYNGEKYLNKQLSSFVNQSYKHWDLFIFDDKSTDGTVDIIENFIKEHSNIHLSINTDTLGYAKNFLESVKKISNTFDYYAFSDQDDIWCDDKLKVAIQALNKNHDYLPKLYCSRTELIDQNDNFIGYSPLFKKKPTFQNSLVQSIAGGNTMVFNKQVFEIIKSHTPISVISHDWYTYLLVTSIGGEVIYDPVPQILYRQHANNIIGSNRGFLSKVSRFKKLLDNSFKKWNTQNIKSLAYSYHYFTENNKKIFDKFQSSREKKLITRLLGLRQAQIYRQTFMGNLALWIGILLNKI
jgi:glycosyltransferase involved in cell wall biosynthesis